MSLAGCMAAGLLFAACSSSIDQTAFKGAAPEIKQVWDKAVTADKANNYVVANTNYVSLLSQPVSPEQLAAVQTALGALNERMNVAAAKGDAAASKALADLKNLQSAARPGMIGPR